MFNQALIDPLLRVQTHPHLQAVLQRLYQTPAKIPGDVKKVSLALLYCTAATPALPTTDSIPAYSRTADSIDEQSTGLLSPDLRPPSTRSQEG